MLDTKFNIAKNPKCVGYQHGPTSMVYKCFDKETADGALKSRNMSNKELAEGLQKPIIRKFEQQKLCSSFEENICGANLTHMQLTSNFNNLFLLCVIDIFSKYGWFIPLKDKKVITTTNAIQKIFHESNRKPNKIWVDCCWNIYHRLKE